MARAPGNSRWAWFGRIRPEFRTVFCFSFLYFHLCFFISWSFGEISLPFWRTYTMFLCLRVRHQSSRDHVSETSRLSCVFLRQTLPSLSAHLAAYTSPWLPGQGLSHMRCFTRVYQQKACLFAFLPDAFLVYHFILFSLIRLFALRTLCTNDRRAYFIFLKSYLIHEDDWFICAMMHACRHYQRAHHIFSFNRTARDERMNEPTSEWTGARSLVANRK